MGPDIRTPMGLMFVLLGGVLVGYGLIADRAIYARSLNINVNLWWGGVILAFGAIMLVLAMRARRASRILPATVPPSERS